MASAFYMHLSEAVYEREGFGIAMADPAARPDAPAATRFELEVTAPADLQGTNYGWDLCSVALRELLSEFEPAISWIDCLVAVGDAEIPFAVPLAPSGLDALHPGRSIMAGGGRIVKPVFRSAALLDRHVFAAGGFLYVSRDVREAYESAALLGAGFTSAPVEP